MDKQDKWWIQMLDPEAETRHDFTPSELIYAKMEPPEDAEYEEDMTCWCITPRDYFESEHAQYDQEICCPGLEEAGFMEMCEGVFEYDGPGDPGTVLEDLGIERSPALENFLNDLYSY